MGGRGASSGMSDKGKPYGTEYVALHELENIKFVKSVDRNVTAPMETMTKGRIYATIDNNNEVKYITFHDDQNKRSKTIEVKGRPHNGVMPHKHLGYEHNEYDTKNKKINLTAREKRIVDKILKEWYAFSKQ